MGRSGPMLGRGTTRPAERVVRPAVLATLRAPGHEGLAAGGAAVVTHVVDVPAVRALDHVVVCHVFSVGTSRCSGAKNERPSPRLFEASVVGA